LYQAEPWTNTEHAAKEIENSAKEVSTLDEIWYSSKRIGSRVKAGLYVMAIVAIAFIPVYYLNILYLWLIWLVSFALLIATTLWLYVLFHKIRTSFETFEKNYYAR
jgi:Flp pilus assembly protein TadB